MSSLNPMTASPAYPPPERSGSGDFQDIRRIRAELVQVKEELQKCSTADHAVDPVVGYLRGWYQNFNQALKDPHQVHPNEGHSQVPSRIGEIF